MWYVSVFIIFFFSGSDFIFKASSKQPHLAGDQTSQQSHCVCDIALQLNPMKARLSPRLLSVTMSPTFRGSLEHLSVVVPLSEDGPVVILVNDSDQENGRPLRQVSSKVCGWNFQLCGYKDKWSSMSERKKMFWV